MGLLGLQRNRSLGFCRSRRRKPGQVVAHVLEGHLDDAPVQHPARELVFREGVLRAEHGLPGVQERGRDVEQHLVRTVADHHLVGMQAVRVGQGAAQIAAAPVGIEMDLGKDSAQRLHHPSAGPERILVGTQLGDDGRIVLGPHLLDGLARDIGLEAPGWTCAPGGARRPRRRRPRPPACGPASGRWPACRQGAGRLAGARLARLRSTWWRLCGHSWRVWRTCGRTCPCGHFFSDFGIGDNVQSSHSRPCRRANGRSPAMADHPPVTTGFQGPISRTQGCPRGWRAAGSGGV